MVDIVAAAGTTVTVPDEAINIVSGPYPSDSGTKCTSAAILGLALSKARKTLPISLADCKLHLQCSHGQTERPFGLKLVPSLY
jgi:hypothetical protein